jgi:hypothetical protein
MVRAYGTRVVAGLSPRTEVPGYWMNRAYGSFRET